MWGRAHTPFNSKLLAGATQLNEMAFAVRETTTNSCMHGKNCTPCINKRLFWRQSIKTIHPFLLLSQRGIKIKSKNYRAKDLTKLPGAKEVKMGLGAGK